MLKKSLMLESNNDVVKRNIFERNKKREGGTARTLGSLRSPRSQRSLGSQRSPRRLTPRGITSREITSILQSNSDLVKRNISRISKKREREIIRTL